MRATFIKHLRNKRLAKAAPEVGMERTPSRVQSIHESLYSNRMTFLNRAARRIGFSRKVVMEHSEMQRFSSIQAAQAGQTLARHPSRQVVAQQRAAAAAASGAVTGIRKSTPA